MAQQPLAGDQPAFRTGADLVIVDAAVVDKAGQPVTNLTAADFEVRDEGRVQAVSLFQTVSVDAAAAQAAGPLAARRYAFSTNTGATAVTGRAFVLFFDDVHLTQAEGDRAKVALTRFLERELQAAISSRWSPRHGAALARADAGRAARARRASSPACAASPA